MNCPKTSIDGGAALDWAPAPPGFRRAVRARGRELLLALFIAAAVACGAISPVQAASFLERAQEYLEQGDLEAAAIELKNALLRNPNDAEARILLGRVYIRQGDSAAAEKELLRAQALGAEGDELDLLLAYARLGQGRLDEVVGSIPEQLGVDSAIHRDLLVARGEALMGLGQFKEAGDLFDLVLNQGPHVRALTNKARISMVLGDAAGARGLLDQAIAIDPNDPLLVAVDAEWYFRERRFNEAKERYERAAQLEPTRLMAYIGQIQSHIALGELAEAEPIMEAIKRSQPDALVVVLQDSILQFLRGNYRAAKVAADRVLAASQDHPQALLIAGRSAYQLEQYEQARARLLSYLAISPTDTQTRMLLGMTMLKLGYAKEAYSTVSLAEGDIPDNTAYLDVLTSAALASGDRAAGLRYLEQLALKVPDNADVQERLGTERGAQGDSAGAVEALQRAIELEPDRLSAYAKLFGAHMQEKNVPAALEQARAIQDRFPDRSLGDTLLGIAYLTEGSRDEARAAFERAFEKEPSNVEAAANLANLLRLQGMNDEARNVLSKVLEAHPGHLGTLLSLAQLANQAGDGAAAEQYWQRAVETNPNDPRARILLGNRMIETRRSAEALAIAEPALASQPNNLAALETVGQARLRTGDQAGALRAFQRLAELVPDNARAQEYLMLALEQNGRIPAALAAAQRTLKLDPSLARARFAEVRFLAQLEDLAQAKSKLQQLKAEFPDQVELSLVEGRIALVEGRNDDALRIFGDAFQQRRNNLVLMDLARAHFAAGQTDAGLGAMRDWVQEYPKDLLVHTALAETYTALGRLNDAERQYQAILEFAPNRTSALNNLAWVRLTLGKSEDAMPLARRALELEPDSPNIADTLAVILLNLGNEREALELLERARQMANDNLGIHFHFAKALAANGNTEGAVQELRALLAKNETFRERPEAEALLARLSQ